MQLHDVLDSELPGGGQLGRMLAAAASRLNIQVVILDTGETGPAKSIVAHSSHIDGSFKDPAHIRSLASKVDVLTVEIEHVDVDALQEALDERKTADRVLKVHPSPSTIRIIQDKYRQKEHLLAGGCPVAPFIQVDPTPDSIRDASVTLGLPLMLKSRTLAYDGRGNFVINHLSQAEEAIAALGNRLLYAEKMVQFEKEVAVMVVRTTTGEVRSYPVAETVHKDSICYLVFAPLRSRDPTLCARAQAIAERAVKSFEGAGIFGVEMFLMKDGARFGSVRNIS
jgi:phosphoribosylaminoimidazole carboxylase